MTDKFGRTINVGDIILYPTSSGHTPYMDVGKVVKTVNNKISVHGTRKWFGRIELKSKPGTLNEPERTVVIERHIVSMEYARLLDQIGEPHERS